MFSLKREDQQERAAQSLAVFIFILAVCAIALAVLGFTSPAKSEPHTMLVCEIKGKYLVCRRERSTFLSVRENNIRYPGGPSTVTDRVRRPQ